MKKFFTLIALAVMAAAPKSAFAQEGITKTTYWNFDQFQKGNENVAFSFQYMRGFFLEPILLLLKLI